MWAEATNGSPSCRAALSSGDPEGELGGHVDHIGPEPGQVVHHVAHSRKGPLDVGIEEEGDAGRPVHLGAVGLARGQRVGRRIDPDLVTPRLERLGEAQQGHPHSAHHGPVDFGEEGYAHVL